LAQVFISYSSADRERAKRLAEAIEKTYSVWWDRQILAGQTFDEVIEQALDQAKCVVVLWSSSSVQSDWVKTEAAEAAKRKVLVPALIDNVKIPLEFRRVQAADLTHWDGGIEDVEFRKLLNAIENEIQEHLKPAPPGSDTVIAPLPDPDSQDLHLSGPTPEHRVSEQPIRREPPSIAKWILVAFAVLAVAVGAMLWRKGSPEVGPTIPTASDVALKTDSQPEPNPPVETKSDPVKPLISKFGAAIVFDPPSNVRVSPNDSSSILCSVRQKLTINIIEQSGTWYTTDVCDGKIGYIHRSQLKFSE
jgi:hypothetical protein